MKKKTVKIVSRLFTSSLYVFNGIHVLTRNCCDLLLLFQWLQDELHTCILITVLPNQFIFSVSVPSSYYISPLLYQVWNNTICMWLYRIWFHNYVQLKRWKALKLELIPKSISFSLPLEGYLLTECKIKAQYKHMQS